MPGTLFPLDEPRVVATATLSACGNYRYDLRRHWRSEPSRIVNFVMLNPSTADARINDPTIRRCVGYAKSWGFGGLVVTNLYAFRSTEPAALLDAADPVGPENDGYLARWASGSGLVVCGWGNSVACDERAHHVLEIIREAGKVPHCLKLTKDGQPGHPLYLRGNLWPIPMGECS